MNERRTTRAPSRLIERWREPLETKWLAALARSSFKPRRVGRPRSLGDVWRAPEGPSEFETLERPFASSNSGAPRPPISRALERSERTTTRSDARSTRSFRARVASAFDSGRPSSAAPAPFAPIDLAKSEPTREPPRLNALGLRPFDGTASRRGARSASFGGRNLARYLDVAGVSRRAFGKPAFHRIASTPTLAPAPDRPIRRFDAVGASDSLGFRAKRANDADASSNPSAPRSFATSLARSRAARFDGPARRPTETPNGGRTERALLREDVASAPSFVRRSTAPERSAIPWESFGVSGAFDAPANRAPGRTLVAPELRARSSRSASDFGLARKIAAPTALETRSVRSNIVRAARSDFARFESAPGAVRRAFAPGPALALERESPRADEDVAPSSVPRDSDGARWESVERLLKESRDALLAILREHSRDAALTIER